MQNDKSRRAVNADLSHGEDPKDPMNGGRIVEEVARYQDRLRVLTEARRLTSHPSRFGEYGVAQ